MARCLLLMDTITEPSNKEKKSKTWVTVEAFIFPQDHFSKQTGCENSQTSNCLVSELNSKGLCLVNSLRLSIEVWIQYATFVQFFFVIIAFSGWADALQHRSTKRSGHEMSQYFFLHIYSSNNGASSIKDLSAGSKCHSRSCFPGIYLVW